jgi:Fe-S oxidoreductase
MLGQFHQQGVREGGTIGLGARSGAEPIHNPSIGGGGGVVTIHRADKLRYKVFELKMEQVEASGADTVLSTCSNCRQSYNDAKEHFQWDKDMESLLELVAENLVE